MRKGIAQFDRNVIDQQLSINIDGLQLFKKSRKCFWTILARFEERNVFPIALYYGNGKPKYRDAFLIDFVEEMLAIQEHGVEIDGKVYRIYIWAAIFDSPARAFVLNVEECNKKEGGCYICDVEGDSGRHRVFFLDVNAKLRNLDTSKSIIFRILDPRNIPLDELHVLALGVMKKCMMLKTDTNYSEFCLIAEKRRLLSENFELAGAYFSKEFNVPLRSLADKRYFTAKEFRGIGLYAGPVVFKDVFTKAEYNHFITLHIAYRILSDEKAIMYDDMLDYADQLLRDYVIDFSKVYAPCFVSFNIHALIHLVLYVRRYRKTLIQLSAFVFEKYNGIIKPFVKLTNDPPVQVGRRMHELTVVYSNKPKRYADEQPKEMRLFGKIAGKNLVFSKCDTGKYFFDGQQLKNRFCEIGDEGKILIINSFMYHNSVPYVRGVFLVNHTQLQDLYSVPCSSPLVHEYKVKLNETMLEGELEEYPLSSISGKYMCLPMKFRDGPCDEYALSKLLH